MFKEYFKSTRRAKEVHSTNMDWMNNMDECAHGVDEI